MYVGRPLVPIKASSTNALTHYNLEEIWNVNAPLGHKMLFGAF
jgi:hypothetical protein